MSVEVEKLVIFDKVEIQPNGRLDFVSVINLTFKNLATVRITTLDKVAGH